MLGRLIGEDVELKTSLDPDLGWVAADPGQIEQVILNLAVNARDAMPRGGKLTIETRNVQLDEMFSRNHDGAQTGCFVMLAVCDTGIGMDKETQTRIFEPFFTTKAKGKGTGLGLSTVYGIVKQSGAYVYVDSEPGQGTTFKIYLPRVEKPAEQVTPEQPPAALARGGENVLLVEDDDLLRKLAENILQQAGYTVFVAANGEEAIWICLRQEVPIQLMLTDVVMPHMSGRELAEVVTQSRPDMRVLYMSGYTDDAMVHHGVMRAEMAFIQKPFSPESLARKVREVLDSTSPRP
jgi:CheY-like chemotaxis protein